MSCVLQLTVILSADVVSFGAQNVSSGMLVASTLAPWGTIERSRGTWEHKKGDLGIKAWISVDSGWTSGPHFDCFWQLLEQQMCFLFCVLQLTFLMIPGSESGCLGMRIEHWF